jgi:hypothetical protein
MAAVTAPRYYVKSVGYHGIGRKSQTPHKVIDRTTGVTVDEYHSKRAATMHARELNQSMGDTVAKSDELNPAFMFQTTST